MTRLDKTNLMTNFLKLVKQFVYKQFVQPAPGNTPQDLEMFSVF